MYEQNMTGSTEANNNRQSILVIGATGRLGKQIVTQLLSHYSRPCIHAFCRAAPKDDWTQRCASIQVGDARKSSDLAGALKDTKASTVIIAIGEGDSVKKTDIRTANAESLVRAIEMTPNLSQNIQIVLVSSIGAGPSKIKMGKLLSTPRPPIYPSVRRKFAIEQWPNLNIPLSTSLLLYDEVD